MPQVGTKALFIFVMPFSHLILCQNWRLLCSTGHCVLWMLNISAGRRRALIGRGPGFWEILLPRYRWRRTEKDTVRAFKEALVLWAERSSVWRRLWRTGWLCKPDRVQGLATTWRTHQIIILTLVTANHFWFLSLFSKEFSYQLFLLLGDLLCSRWTVMAFSSVGFRRKGILFGENSLTKTRIWVIIQ